MRVITKKYTVYKYDELTEPAKNKAMSEALQFFLDTPYEYLSKNMQKAVEHANNMQTPWFTHEYIMQYAKDEVIAFCTEYEYLANGDVFSA